MARTIEKCICCGMSPEQLGTDHTLFIKGDLSRRGGRVCYCCPQCWRLKEYSEKNNRFIGTPTKDGFTFGVELETAYTDSEAQMELLADGYMPTKDITVNIEYKSPIMYGMKTLDKHMQTVENLMENDDLSIDDRCGTHFHVGHVDNINKQGIKMIADAYKSLFDPLSKEIEDNPNEAIRFWGRCFNDWAEPTHTTESRYFDPYDHTNFVNLQHEHTIEFRLPRYWNHDQYMRIAKFCKDVTSCIINNYLNHYDNDNWSHTLYKADLTGQKIVKLYRKAVKELDMR